MKPAAKQCVILVGGLGTRLGSLTENCPKPLLPVAGVSFLEHLIRQVHRFGYRNFVLLAGYRAEMVEEFAADLQGRLDCNIHVIAEPVQLGTGGALKYAEQSLAERFLLMNGDSFFDIDLAAFVERSRAHPDAVSMALRMVPDASRYGVVRLEHERVVAFAERPDGPGPGLVNAGIYSVPRNVVDYIQQGFCSLEKDVFPLILESGRFYGYVFDGAFVDIGIKEDLQKAKNIITDCLRCN